MENVLGHRRGGLDFVPERYRRVPMPKEICCLFQLGETLNSELQIITSVFNKVIHRGEYWLHSYLYKS